MKVKVKATPQDILQFIQRQEKVLSPNQIYLNWLRKQFKLACDAEVIKKK